MARRCWVFVPFVVLALCIWPAWAWSINATIEAVENTVVLHENGEADFYVQVQWNVGAPDTMGGFDYQGIGFMPKWDKQQCYVEDAAQRYGLSIKEGSSGLWMVDIADGKRVGGKTFWRLVYSGDVIEEGFVGQTTAEDGRELLYFHWAPVEWDQALSYRLVTLVLPVYVSGERLTQAEKDAVPMRTEKFVNEENKIDFVGVKDYEGKYRLGIKFYQASVAPQGEQTLQLYFPIEYVALESKARSSLKDLPGKLFDFGPGVWLTLLSLGSGAGMWFLGRRRKKEQSVEGADVADYDKGEWIRPELLSGGFKEEGKVADWLEPVEVAVLFGMDLKKIIAIMLDILASREAIEVVSLAPVQIRKKSAHALGGKYEGAFLAAFLADGRVDEPAMTKFFEHVLYETQNALWDCDIEASKAYYLYAIDDDGLSARLEQRVADSQQKDEAQDEQELFGAQGGQFAQSSGALQTGHPVQGVERLQSNTWLMLYALLKQRPQYNGYQYYEDLQLPAKLDTSIPGFMGSSACFHQCFSAFGENKVTGSIAPFDSSQVCHSACHDACHSACHDACHSACHDACHSACHDACHSACVSGGAR